MANIDIVNYLKEGQKRGFPTDRLKGELLKGGFNERSVDEAIATLSPISTINLPSEYSQQKPLAEKGFKWMKLAAIIGFIFFVLYIGGILYSLLAPPKITNEIIMTPESAASSIMPATGILILIILVFVVYLAMYALYYFGFFKMGKYTESKALKFSGISLMIWPAVVVILAITSYFLLKSLAATLSVGPSYTPLYILGIMWGIFILFYLVVQLLLAIGLIKVRDKVKFALIAGILNLIFVIATVALLLLAVLIIVAIKNAGPLALFAPSEGLIPMFSISKYIYYAQMIITPLITLFASLALLDASKKFE